jgi:F-type H+-transporting ATPase subunit epsilon
VAERAEEIDIARAEAAKRRAEEFMAKPMPDADFERARIALLRAINRLELSRHSRPRRS